MTDNARGTLEYDATHASVLAREARTALDASDLMIDSPEMLAIAGDDLKAIKALQKRVEEKRLAITAPLNDAVRAINDLFRAPKEYLDQAERSLKRTILGYAVAQEKIDSDLRRKAEEAARVERTMLMAEQRGQESIARKAQMSADVARNAVDAARLAGDLDAVAAAQEQERLGTASAERAQAQADAAAQTAEVLTIPPLVAAAAKISGVIGRTTFSVVVEDLMALVRAVAEGAAPQQALKPDDKFLGAQARAFKRTGLIYPGVTAIAERSLAAKAS